MNVGILRTALLFGLVVTSACHGPPSTTEPTAEPSVRANADLEDRYRLAIRAFNGGAYDDAAAQFAQMVLHVPRDPTGDELRHLLIQHVAWSLLGSYDMSRDPSKLDSGEAMLERYLVKHEQLRPEATGERDEIYALLGEYTLRRDDQPPTNANAHLQALVQHTHENLQQPTPRKHSSNEDRMVREVEVRTVPWATLEDPKVQLYFRDPRYTGGSLFDQQKLFNETRVLVRGWVGEPWRSSKAAKRQAWDTLRVARPALESCYEDALGRGADMHEKMELDLRWNPRAAAEVVATDQTTYDTQFSSCVIAALREVAKADGEQTQQAELHLSFFVQPPRAAERRTGHINQWSRPEDVEITPCVQKCAMPSGFGFQTP